MKKKIIVIVSIIAAIILFAITIPFVIYKAKEIKANNERINSSTLMEYVKTHDWAHLKYKYKDDAYLYDVYSMEYAGENFKCNVLNNKNVIAVYDEYMFLEDYSIYKFSLVNLYSNNQNCMEINPGIHIKEIKNNGEYIIDENNDLYIFTPYKANNNEPIVTKIEHNTWGSEIYYDYIKEEGVKGLYSIDSNYNSTEKRTEKVMWVLKTDGNLYKQLYYDKNINDYELVKEEIIFSKEKYGKIKNITYGNNVYDNEFDYGIYLKDTQVLTLTTDTGYYFLDVIKTNDCVKYEDVKCEVAIEKSKIFKKYSDDIKYIGINYTILKDNTIINTNILSYDLDKDVK